MNNLSYVPTHPKDNLYKFFSVTGIIILLLSIIVPLLLERDVAIRTIQIQGELDLMSAELDYSGQDIARAQQAINEGKIIDVEALEKLENRNREQHLKIVETGTKIKLNQRLISKINQIRKIKNFGIISGLFIFLVGFLLWYVKLQRYQVS
jgi:hypothetical protein